VTEQGLLSLSTHYIKFQRQVFPVTQKQEQPIVKKQKKNTK